MIDFEVTWPAWEYIQSYFFNKSSLSDKERLSGCVVHPAPMANMERHYDWVGLSRDEVMQKAKELVEKWKADEKLNPKNLHYEWIVGWGPRSHYRDRGIEADVHVLQGVPVYLPEQIMNLLDGRKVVLENGRLRIVPEPPQPYSSAP